MEIIHPDSRGFISMVAESCASGVGIALSSLNGLVVNSWIYNCVFLAAKVGLLIPVSMAMQESYRWYFGHGRIEEGKMSLEKFCRESGYTYDEKVVEEILAKEKSM